MNTLTNSIAPAGRSAADARLELIARLSNAAAGSAPIHTQMTEAAGLARAQFGADACLLRRIEGRDLVLLAGSGMPPEHCRPRIAAGWGIGGEIVSKRRPLFISDVTGNPLTAPLANALPNSFPFGAYAGAPLIADGEPVGILGLYFADRTLTEASIDLDFLQTVANILASAVVKSRLEAEIKSRDEALENQQTERRILEVELVHAQKLESIGRLAGEVAHNFNNMLTVMQGFSELARADISADHPAQRHLESIAAACVRTESLTRQMLAFARREVIAPSAVRLQPLVRDAAQMLVPLLGPGITLDIEIMTKTDTVFVDPGQMEHVLVNLMVNARDAMSGRGTLTLRLDQRMLSERDCVAYDGLAPGEHVCIEIADTGCGMTDEVRRRIFEPFFTTKVQGKGTGIGLATCYTAVKQNRGDIQVESAPGQGATFRILLPVSRPAAEPREPARPEPTLACGDERILLADGERAVRDVAAESLRRYGYTVCVAATGREAFETAVAHSGRFSLVITDTVLTDMTGPDLAARIQALYPEIRVLFASGGFEPDAAECAADHRPCPLRKPFTPEQLARRVRLAVMG